MSKLWTRNFWCLCSFMMNTIRIYYCVWKLIFWVYCDIVACVQTVTVLWRNCVNFCLMMSTINVSENKVSILNKLISKKFCILWSWMIINMSLLTCWNDLLKLSPNCYLIIVWEAWQRIFWALNCHTILVFLFYCRYLATAHH